MSQTVSQAVKMIGISLAITMLVLTGSPSSQAAATWTSVSGCTGWQKYAYTSGTASYDFFRLSSTKAVVFLYDRKDKQWYDFGTDGLPNALGYTGMSSTFIGNGVKNYIGTATTGSGSSKVYYQYTKATGSNGYCEYSYYYQSTFVSLSSSTPYAKYKYHYGTGAWYQNLGLGYAKINPYMAAGKTTSSRMVYDGKWHRLNTTDGQNGLYFKFDGSYAYWSYQASNVSGTIAMYSNLSKSYLYNYALYFGITPW